MDVGRVEQNCAICGKLGHTSSNCWHGGGGKKAQDKGKSKGKYGKPGGKSKWPKSTKSDKSGKKFDGACNYCKTKQATWQTIVAESIGMKRRRLVALMANQHQKALRKGRSK